MTHFLTNHPRLTPITLCCLALFSCILSSCEESKRKKRSRPAQTEFDATQAEKGVLRILVVTRKSTPKGTSYQYGSGSGFYIGDDHVVTNNHVINKASKGKLVVARKNSATSIEIRDATVLWTDKELDIAILKVPGISCEPLTLSEATIEKGSRAYAIGFPVSADASRRSGSGKMGKSGMAFVNLAYSSKRGIIEDSSIGLVQFLDPTVSSGEIRKTLTRKWQPSYKTELQVLDHDVNIGHGNSGGPLFDECGRVIGINTSGLDSQSVKGLAIADNVKISSRITELIKVLEKENLTADITSRPCVIDPPQTAPTGIDWKIWLILSIIAAAAIAALLVAIFKKPTAESYTQYLGRVSGVSRLYKRPPSGTPPRKVRTAMDTHPAAAPPQLPSQTAPQTAPSVWILQGNNPEPDKTPNIHFKLTSDLFKLHGGEITIGRKHGVAYFLIDNTSISKGHATLSFSNGTLSIRDNNSSNGTSVNGARLTAGEQVPLHPGNKIQLGEVTLSFS